VTEVGRPVGSSETPVTEVAFVGFGDLASTWAAALWPRAGVRLRAFLPADSPSRGTGLAAQRERRSGLIAGTDLAAVLEGAGLVFAAVPASAATAVAAACAPHMHPGTVYVDPSPGSPEHKQEIAPALLREAAVIVDDMEQCARIGDLHHALVLGVMRPSDVRASLDQVVAGTATGRINDTEIVIFDSTGVAIEDVAAAAVVYERAENAARS